MRGRGNSCYGFRPDYPAVRGRAVARTVAAPIPLGLFAAVFIAIALAGLAALLMIVGPLTAYAVNETGAGLPAPVLANRSVSAAECANGYVLDLAGLPAGTILSEQYASLGVHISGATSRTDRPDAVIVFNSNGTGSHAPDLEVGIGNIAILPYNLSDKNGDGLVDFPVDSNSGGEQIYTFDSPVHIGSFLFIDKDHGTPDRATAYDANDNVISSVPIPVGANSSVQTINVNADNAVKLEIRYRDSGGLTGIEICPATVAPSPQPPSSGVANPVVATPRTVKQQSLPGTVALPVALPHTGGPPESNPAIGAKELAVGVLALFGACAVAGLPRRSRLR